jgi:hypothetical protein
MSLEMRRDHTAQSSRFLKPQDSGIPTFFVRVAPDVISLELCTPKHVLV